MGSVRRDGNRCSQDGDWCRPKRFLCLSGYIRGSHNFSVISRVNENLGIPAYHYVPNTVCIENQVPDPVNFPSKVGIPPIALMPAMF